MTPWQSCAAGVSVCCAGLTVAKTVGWCEPLSEMGIHAPAHNRKGIRHNRKQRNNRRMVKS
jgi:hypothetical protein